MTARNRTYRYTVGQEIAGRVVIAHVELGTARQENKYQIRYACCGLTLTIREASLRDAERQGGSSCCRRCNGVRTGRKLKTPQIPKEWGQLAHKYWQPPPSVRKS